MVGNNASIPTGVEAQSTLRELSRSPKWKYIYTEESPRRSFLREKRHWVRYLKPKGYLTPPLKVNTIQRVAQEGIGLIAATPKH